MQLPGSVVFSSPGHDIKRALDDSIKAYREKTLFTEPYVFHHDSSKGKLTKNGGRGLESKNTWAGGGGRVASHYDTKQELK